MKVVNLKQLMKNQTSIVYSEEEYCDQLYQKQPKGLAEEQWNPPPPHDQHQMKQKYHFGHLGEQLHKREICDMQIEILTRDYEWKDAIKDD